MSLLLTKDERDRFAAYLEREASSAAFIIEQMQKMKVPEALIQREKNEAAAALLIAHKLRATQDG